MQFFGSLLYSLEILLVYEARVLWTRPFPSRSSSLKPTQHEHVWSLTGSHLVSWASLTDVSNWVFRCQSETIVDHDLGNGAYLLDLNVDSWSDLYNSETILLHEFAHTNCRMVFKIVFPLTIHVHKFQTFYSFFNLDNFISASCNRSNCLVNFCYRIFYIFLLRF